MKKLLKTEMQGRLIKKFPQINGISRESTTNNLKVSCKSIAYIRKVESKEEEIKPRISFKIACINPKDQKEPYTEETLEKALQEFPTLFKNQISKIKQSPGFISFSTYNAELTKEELEKDIDHVFNFSTYNMDNDPVRNVSMIKTVKKSPLLPKISRQKKDKLF